MALCYLLFLRNFSNGNSISNERYKFTKKYDFIRKLEANFNLEGNFTEKTKIRSNYSIYTITDCIFTSCTSSGNGGAIEISFPLDATAKLNVKTSAFESCISSANGGAISSFIPTSMYSKLACTRCSAPSLGNFIFTVTMSVLDCSDVSLGPMEEESSGKGSLYFESGKQTIRNINTSYLRTINDVADICTKAESITTLDFVQSACCSGKHAMSFQPNVAATVSRITTYNFSTNYRNFISLLHISNDIVFKECYFYDSTKKFLSSDKGNGTFQNCYSLISIPEYGISVIENPSFDPSLRPEGSPIIPTPTLQVVYVEKAGTAWLVSVIVLGILLFIFAIFNITYFFVVPAINKRNEELKAKKEAAAAAASNDNNKDPNAKTDDENPADGEEEEEDKDSNKKSSSSSDDEYYDNEKKRNKATHDYYEEEDEKEGKEKKRRDDFEEEVSNKSSKSKKSENIHKHNTYDDYYHDTEYQKSRTSSKKSAKQKKGINWDDYYSDNETNKNESISDDEKSQRSKRSNRKSPSVHSRHSKSEQNEVVEEEKSNRVTPKKSDKSSSSSGTESLDDIENAENNHQRRKRRVRKQNTSQPSNELLNIEENNHHRRKRRVRKN